MITAAQATQYLDTALGISLPSFLVTAAVDKVEPAEPAMATAGYTEADQTLIQCLAVAIIAAAGAPRRLQNQAAPSGASRGFKYADADLSTLRRQLALLDTAGTVTDIVGADPAQATLFMVV